ncbi:hypothetical protein BDB01DRAFT_778256 [Pilobolus umbonatus]|nr:hypothetical protein BDB01DRAFT_778256 [Pilobolus umbonatus]
MVISATSPVLSNASLSNTTASAISTNRRMARRSTITPVFDIELDRLEVRIKNKHIRGRLESGDRPKQSKIPKKLSTQKKHEERERSKQLEKEKKKKEREEERLMLKEQERQRKEEERKRKEEAKAYKLLENMRTMDDIHYDPVKEVDLEKSMFEFINDIDGIVSKTYKEAVMQQEAEKIKQQNMKKLNLEEQAELKRKEEEEAERKRKIELQKQEERRKQNANVLQETSNSLQVRLVNGQIVLDADSLTVDRGHSSINYEDGSMEVVEESSMTKKVNSHSYGKRKASSRWTAEETENFYEALSQFGTDFEMISKVMPGRLRSQIRSKFTREERVNPGKVTDYMIRKRKPVDIKEFEKITGMELDEVPEDFMDM